MGLGCSPRALFPERKSLQQLSAPGREETEGRGCGGKADDTVMKSYEEQQIPAPTICWYSISQARTFPKVSDGKLDQGLGVGGTVCGDSTKTKQ